MYHQIPQQKFSKAPLSWDISVTIEQTEMNTNVDFQILP